MVQQIGPDLYRQYYSGPADKARPVQTMPIVNNTIVAQPIGPDLDTDHDNSERYHSGPADRARPGYRP